MAKSTGGSSYWAELLKFDLYKRNQGRLTRQLTAVAAAVLVFFAAYSLSKGPLSGYVNAVMSMSVRYATGQVDEGSLIGLAREQGGQLADTRRGERFQQLTFHFPASRRWQTSSVMVEEAKEDCREFRQAVQVKHGTKVRISEPRQQNRQATVIAIGIPVLLCVVAGWMIFRAVNYPRFADFLISVEAEMDKVSWPSRRELYRSTMVVLCTMFFLGFMLLTFDALWKPFFELIRFLRLTET